MKIKMIILLLLMFILCGCGYTTRVYNLPGHLKSVYIETFKNYTDEPNIENDLRTKIIAAFQNDGNLNIATNEEADAVLKGSLVGYSRHGLRYDSNQGVQEYRLVISVNFEFIDKSTNTVIIDAVNFSGDTSFYLTGSQALSEKTARSQALDDLSHRILNKIITLW
ncbi:MAG: LptE family protein [Candidatus Omnitrophota bacterium]